MNARERRSILRAAYNASKAGQLEAQRASIPYKWNFRTSLYLVQFKYPQPCRGCKMPRRYGRSYDTRFVNMGKLHRSLPTWGPQRVRRWMCQHCRTWNDTPQAHLRGKPTRRNDSYMKRQSRPR